MQNFPASFLIIPAKAESLDSNFFAGLADFGVSLYNVSFL